MGAGLSPWYAGSEIVVAIVAVIGNALVIVAFAKERRLRRRTNYYIVSLAVADLLVGLLGIPCALLAEVGRPHSRLPCLFTLSLLVVLCTISIFSLVAVSVDRYWAILHPMGYSRNVRTKTAIYIICACWWAGGLIGFLPMFGWYSTEGWLREEKCRFTLVMDYSFLVFLYFSTIIFPALLMAAFYAHIYSVVLKQIRQMFTVNGTAEGRMLRVLGAPMKRDVKATKNLSIIVLFFIICWFPLYTVNFIQALCPNCYVNPVVMKFLIILTHANSAGNPLLYAYHLTDFRMALRVLLCEEKEELVQPKRPVFKIPSSTPKLPHKIFELETPEPEPLDDSRYEILRMGGEGGSRCSVDSSATVADESCPAFGRSRSTPATPTLCGRLHHHQPADPT